MQKKKTVKKGSKRKKSFFTYEDLTKLKQNLRFLLPVMLIVSLLPPFFLTLVDVADSFLDVHAKSSILSIVLLIAIILYPLALFVFFIIDVSLEKRIRIIRFGVFPGIFLLLISWIFDPYNFLPALIPSVFWIAYFLWFISYLAFLQFFPVKDFNYHAAYVVIGCLLLFVIGMSIAFNSVFDAQTKLGLYLNECETNERISGAHFTCEGLREDLFVGEQANCVIYGLEHDNLTTELIFTHFNGTSSYYVFSSGNNISFIVPADVARVHVNIQSESGKETCASSADNMTFTTYANFRQQLKELGFYFVAIISFILLYVPTIVNKWMDLFKRKGKK